MGIAVFCGYLVCGMSIRRTGFVEIELCMNSSLYLGPMGRPGTCPQYGQKEI